MKHHLARTKQNIKPCSQVEDDVASLFKKLLEDNKDEKDKKKMTCMILGVHPIIISKTMMKSLKYHKTKEKGKAQWMASWLKGKIQNNQHLITFGKKGDRESVVLAICRFFYANALPFNVVKSPFFAPMMEAVATFGPGLKLPSFHEVRQWPHLDQD
eukprot:TRINITY_DN23789_c0_g2_i4.p1 TRINITY_DN23789_c0_g2~~TRINITY_DN23789_c0_g2_i4.p1  ORF type:complete len:157 (-),score=25.48 TRINITY_DN23789_c0_g2_i4:279-749(-)